MSERKWTKGPVEALPWEAEAGGKDWNVWGLSPSNHPGDPNLRGDFGSEADARLVVEAFNVANETGMSPAQMCDEMKRRGVLLNEAADKIDKLADRVRELEGLLSKACASVENQANWDKKPYSEGYYQARTALSQKDRQG